ncbi:unnamed protein product [Withania somnifera]
MATKSLKLFAFFTIISMANSVIAMAIFDPILAPGPNDNEVTECWSPLKSTNGCIEGVYKVLIGIRWLDSPCCQVINEIDTKCWPIVFPFNPNFGDLLRYYCSLNVAPAPSPFEY